jgi:hypothetical protein
MVSRSVEKEIRGSNISPWASMNTLFHDADIIAGNLEGAIGDKVDEMGSYSLPLFKTDSSFIPILGRAGFKILTIENNHSGDLGQEGKNETINVLRKCNINPVDFNNSPFFFTVNDKTIGVIALNQVPGRHQVPLVIPSIEVEQKLRLAGTLADVVIISIHWGSEYLTWPDKKQKAAAEWLTSHGADIIIGSHPHVIQAPEIINSRPVFFSLGNHLFDQKYDDTKEGMIAGIKIHGDGVSCFGITTVTAHHSFYPEPSGKKTTSICSFRIKENSLNIAGYDIRPVSVWIGGESKIVLQAWKDDRKVWSTEPLPIVSLFKAKLNGSDDFLFILEKHYSDIDRKVSLRPYVYQADDGGLVARWRGSALSWPILDAIIPDNTDGSLYVLHSGDSFINPGDKSGIKRVGVYRWTGFGFKGITDSASVQKCRSLFNDYR